METKRPTLEKYWPSSDFEYKLERVMKLDTESSTEVNIHVIAPNTAMYHSATNFIRVNGRRIPNRGFLDHNMFIDKRIDETLFRLEFDKLYTLYEMLPEDYSVETVEKNGVSRYLVRSTSKPGFQGGVEAKLEDDGKRATLELRLSTL